MHLSRPSMKSEVAVLSLRADLPTRPSALVRRRGTQGYSLGNGSSAYRLHRAHSGKVNTLFADGHVAAMPAEYFDTIVLQQREYISGSQAYQFWPEVSQ